MLGFRLHERKSLSLRCMSRFRSLYIPIFIAVFGFLCTVWFNQIPNFPSTTRSLARVKAAVFEPTNTSMSMTASKRTPVYFLSHGGPNIMYDTSHPVYGRLQSLGTEITSKVRPIAVVVFSAHWQSETAKEAIQVNVSEEEPLLYDFYGFPRHYYMEKFPNRGSTGIANRVMQALGDAGIESEGVERGLDHGVWAAFKVAFDPEKNPLDIPIVQVSLWGDEFEKDAMKHIKLGRAVAKLRDEGILIIVSGMAVHNLRDLGRMRGLGAFPYTESFDEALREAVAVKPGPERDESMVSLLKRPDARQAHPSFEHLLPIHIGVGAAGSDQGERLWTMPEGSMSWAQYRFGEVGA